MAPRGREAPAADGPTARWGRLSLSLHRNSNGTFEWAIVHTSVSGVRRWDRRLMWGRLQCAPGTRVSQEPLAALSAALEAAESLRAGQETPPPALPPQGAGPPGGRQGDTPRGS